MASAAAASSFATGVAPVSRARGHVRARAVRAVRVRAAVSEPSTPDASVSAPAPRTTDQVFVDALAPGVSSVRCVCRERLKFEVEYGMQRGSTDNSYIIVGERSTALLDLPDKSFAQAFAKTVDCANVDFVVLGHLSPKRLDSLAALLEARPADAPALEVWCSNPAAQVIYQALKPGTPASNEALTGAWKGANGLRARLRTVRTGDALDLGGRSLDFVTAPTPRWPDTVVTYDTASKFLFTSKLFSAHVATGRGAPDGRGRERRLRGVPRRLALLLRLHARAHGATSPPPRSTSSRRTSPASPPPRDRRDPRLRNPRPVRPWRPS